MKRIILRILAITVVASAVVGFLIYEGYSITRKEYERQNEIATAAHTEINLRLDMIKIAIQTNDAEIYAENLNKIHDEVSTINTLFLLKEQEADYAAWLEEYVGVLEEKKELLVEMQSLKNRVAEIKKTLKEKYSNKDEISRDKLKEAKDEVLKLKIDKAEYQEEKIINYVNEVNGVLDTMAGKIGALIDCIDTCYKNRINEIDDELAEALKAFSDKAVKINTTFEKEFKFAGMEALKVYKKEYNSKEGEEDIVEGESNE